MATKNQHLKDAGIPANGRCWVCGKEIAPGSIFCPGDDSRLVGSLAQDPASAPALREAMRAHAAEWLDGPVETGVRN